MEKRGGQICFLSFAADVAFFLKRHEGVGESSKGSLDDNLEGGKEQDWGAASTVQGGEPRQLRRPASLGSRTAPWSRSGCPASGGKGRITAALVALETSRLVWLGVCLNLGRLARLSPRHQNHVCYESKRSARVWVTVTMQGTRPPDGGGDLSPPLEKMPRGPHRTLMTNGDLRPAWCRGSRGCSTGVGRPPRCQHFLEPRNT